MNPIFKVEVVELESAGQVTHALKVCPRCGCNMGITRGMLAGLESIICKGRFQNGHLCNGHYYFRRGALEFVGTA